MGESKPMTLDEAFREALNDKGELLDKLEPQMRERVDAGTMSKVTSQKWVLASECLLSARTHYKNREFKDAAFLFSRCCVNIGELMGRADKEKKES